MTRALYKVIQVRKKGEGEHHLSRVEDEEVKRSFAATFAGNVSPLPCLSNTSSLIVREQEFCGLLNI